MFQLNPLILKKLFFSDHSYVRSILHSIFAEDILSKIACFGILPDELFSLARFFWKGKNELVFFFFSNFKPPSIDQVLSSSFREIKLAIDNAGIDFDVNDVKCVFFCMDMFFCDVKYRHSYSLKNENSNDVFLNIQCEIFELEKYKILQEKCDKLLSQWLCFFANGNNISSDKLDGFDKDVVSAFEFLNDSYYTVNEKIEYNFSQKFCNSAIWFYRNSYQEGFQDGKSTGQNELINMLIGLLDDKNIDYKFVDTAIRALANGGSKLNFKKLN